MQYIFLGILPFLTVFLNGQDAVFSQFYNNPVLTNPALTGVFNGKNRIGTIYRNQWFGIEPKTSITTTGLFYDRKSNIINNDFLGIGITLFDDRLAMANIKKTSGYINISYSKHLHYNKYKDINQFLVFGIQTGFGITYFSNSEFLFGSQFNKLSGSVDPTMPSGENLLNSKLYPDVNLGLMWYRTGKINSFYAGGSISHINGPDISLVAGNSDRLKMRYSGLIGGEFSLNREFSLLPSLFFNMQGQLVQAITGYNIRYEYFSQDKNAFRIGLWTRITNSIDGITVSDIIFSTVSEFSNLLIGLSYDITISNLSNITGYKGAFELSLIYIMGDNPKYQPLKCPRF